MPANADRLSVSDDERRLQAFWNERYRHGTLRESGWLGAGDLLNERLYACKDAALSTTLASLGFTRDEPRAVLDAGCGLGYFAQFYRREWPDIRYVGLDLSDRAVEHARRSIDAEFHVGNLAEWNDPDRRLFDIVQSFDVLHLMLDDDLFARALNNLGRMTSARGALVISTPLPAHTLQPASYLRYRSRRVWEDALAAAGLRIVEERRMYYWLPAGGPSNKYLRYAFDRLGAGALFSIDRLALALRLPQSRNIGIDCRTRLLTIRRAR